MGNIVTYAETALDTFQQRPFCAADSLILSWVSYFHLTDDMEETASWEGVPFARLFRAEAFDRLLKNVWDQEDSRRLFFALAASPRFRDVLVRGFRQQLDPQQEKQFAAVSFQLEPEQCYIAYRGTNATLVGWKEDFNMAFQYPIPSQAEAAKYLADAAHYCTGRIRTGGHSKGGNLAVYAAANAGEAVRQRLEAVYSHDGPGFLEKVLQSPEYLAIGEKIQKTIPQSSIIGMLLEHQENFRIVKSNRFSVWQHDPFSWVMENMDFCYIDQLTPDAVYLDRTLNGWLGSLTAEQRERFVDSLYALVDTNDATTLAQFRSDWQKNLPAVTRAVNRMDPETKEFVLQTVRALAALSVKNFPELFKPAEKILHEAGREA